MPTGEERIKAPATRTTTAMAGNAVLVRNGFLGPRFVDPAVERDYRTDMALVRQQALRFSVIVAFVMTVVAMAFQLFGSHLNWAHPMTGWLGGNLLLAMVFLVLSRSPPTTPSILAPIFALVCGLDVAVVAPLMLSSHGWGQVLLKYGYFGPVLLTFLPFLLLRMPFAEGMAVDIVVLFSYVVVLWLVPGLPTGHRLMHTNNVVLAGIAAGAGGWLLDSLQRDNYAQRREVESLLLNILPAAIASRLKLGESPIADAATQVGVVFADIVGFTQFAQAHSPAEVVQLLDRVFSRFDDIAVQHGMEKIKTVGDAYLAVSGLPVAREDHADAAARFAMAIVGEVATIGASHGLPLALRVGIDCGPVVAGVIGRHKFSYDVWGDTVNTASRMESQGEPGRIQITERAVRRLSAGFQVERRGEIEIKGKGLMETWWLVR